jgi:hypothetical protein
VALTRGTALLLAIAAPFQLVIVLLYWLLLAGPQPTPFAVWDNAESHAVKGALIWLDVLVSATRLPAPHALVTLASALVYLATNAAVSLADAPVYSVLTWRTGGSAVLVVGATALAVAAFFLASSLARARDALARRGAKQGGGGSGGLGGGSGAGSATYPRVFDDDDDVRVCPCGARARAAVAAVETAEQELPAE